MATSLRLAVLTLGAYLSSAQAQHGYLTYNTDANPNGVTAADLNNDGKPDLIIANLGSSTLTVLLNDGAGAFTPATSIPLTGAPRTTVAADLNGDGKADLLVNAINGVLVLLGNGDGTFQAAQTLPGVPSPTSLQVADFDGDGIPDLAITSLTYGFLIPTGANLSILPGQGDGTFRAGTSTFLGLTPWAVLTTGDFNQDGKPDLAVAIGQDLTVLLNDGRANFQTLLSPQPWNFAPGIVSGDFNGDGIADLAVTGQLVAPDPTHPGAGILAILLGKGGGTFQKATTISTATVGQTAAAADLNRDGFTDLVVGLSSLTYFQGRGDGVFAAGLPFAPSASSGYLAIADFNGGGAMGFAGTNSNGSAVILPSAAWPSLTLTNVSAADFSLGPLAPGSLATAFGSNLATQASGNAVTITAADGQTLSGQLLYASPGQVNYLIPQGTVPGRATVTITSDSRVTATGPIDIASVAPALFPGGYLTQVNDAVYLTVFGTGMRNAKNPTAATSSVGQITYLGPQGSFDGLDQVNILLPPATTTGNIVVQLQVDGQPSNRVSVAIQF